MTHLPMGDQSRTIAHVTHEAVHKAGGIGTVLEGLLTSEPYRQADLRTILVGPLFSTDGSAEDRLGEGGDVLYSSIDGIAKHHQIADALDPVRRQFRVGIVYGHRSYFNPHNNVRATAEVLLFETSHMKLESINLFKAGLWDEFGIDSMRYEHSWEYDLYVKLAQPALAALRALGAASRPAQCIIVAHEFFGMPTALATRFDDSDAFRTIFHAHETATVRPIVESLAGHDVAFYNVLDHALSHGRHIDDVFGPQDHYYRHPLVKAASSCDRIFAVGDDVARELRFLAPCMKDAAIDITYNGIPSSQITLEQRKTSRARMADYAEALLGDRPDYVFTHVTRTVTSKGLWRDLRVLEHLEKTFRRTNKSAVLFVLSTELPQRSPRDVARMEADWQWPLAHREKDSDLSWGEAIFYAGVQAFNTRARQIKVIFVNQFGWSPQLCGRRMPRNMTILDIRRGTDVEFGMSVYEPFGISQLEPLTYGGICVMSKVCGSAGLVDRLTGGQGLPNVLIADFCDTGEARDELGWLTLSRKERHAHEVRVAARISGQLAELLPASDTQMEALLERGYQLASKMGWDVIARKFIMPAIDELSPDRTQIRVA